MRHKVNNVALLFAVLVTAHSSLAQTSTIRTVVVFADRAEVTRRAQAHCSDDAATLSFAGLPVQLDERTLRAEAVGVAEIIGVSSRMTTLEHASDPRVQALQDDLDKLDAEIATLQDVEASYAARDNAATAYRAYFLSWWTEDMRALKPDMKRWGSGLDKLRIENLELVQKRFETQQKLRETWNKLGVLQRQMGHYADAEQREVQDAEVAVACKGQNSVVVDLSYMVPGATWRPEYDIRFRANNKKGVGKGSVELTVAAVIQQASGEDWNDVKVTLSTAKPRLGSEAPMPQMLMIDGHETGQEKVLVQATEKREALAAGEQVSTKTARAVDIEDHGQSVVLKVPQRVSIGANSNPHWFPIDVVTGQGEAKLVTVPKLSRYVYHVVELRNPAAYPLLAGPVHIYRNDAYVGDSSVDYLASGQPVEISFGIDDAYKIERIDLAEVDRGASFGFGDKKLERAYRVELESQSNTSQHIEVRERIPVSKVDDVRVELDNKKTSAGYKLDKHRGFVSWNLAVSAGKSAAVELHYSIKLPDSWQVQ